MRLSAGFVERVEANPAGRTAVRASTMGTVECDRFRMIFRIGSGHRFLADFFAGETCAQGWAQTSCRFRFATPAAASESATKTGLPQSRAAVTFLRLEKQQIALRAKEAAVVVWHVRRHQKMPRRKPRMGYPAAPLVLRAIHRKLPIDQGSEEPAASRPELRAASDGLQKRVERTRTGCSLFDRRHRSTMADDDQPTIRDEALRAPDYRQRHDGIVCSMHHDPRHRYGRHPVH